MLTKDQFVSIIGKLAHTNQFVNTINKLIKDYRDTVELDFINSNGLFIEHEDLVIKLLENILNDETELISWWIYELDYGKEYESGCFIDNGKNVDLSTSEKLYDYLTRNKG